MSAPRRFSGKTSLSKAKYRRARSRISKTGLRRLRDVIVILNIADPVLMLCREIVYPIKWLQYVVCFGLKRRRTRA
jgi:hypothetical protein